MTTVGMGGWKWQKIPWVPFPRQQWCLWQKSADRQVLCNSLCASECESKSLCLPSTKTHTELEISDHKRWACGMNAKITSENILAKRNTHFFLFSAVDPYYKKECSYFQQHCWYYAIQNDTIIQSYSKSQWMYTTMNIAFGNQYSVLGQCWP